MSQDEIRIGGCLKNYVAVYINHLKQYAEPDVRAQQI